MKLTTRQKIKKWWKEPFYANMALDTCDEIAKEVPLDMRKQFFDIFIKNDNVDIIVRHLLEKDHKSHLIRC